jgi:hypothetical protein
MLANGQRVPSALVLGRIERLTNGEVALRDWVGLAEAAGR